MTATETNLPSDLRGAARLSIDAVTGVVGLVESMHQTILTAGGLLGQRERTRGITGLVYRNILAVTNLVGDSIDLLLAPFDALAADTTSSPRRDALLSALNGVAGDHLAATGNPLAISMQFRRDGQPLSGPDLAAALAAGDGRVVILVHGAFMNDRQWRRSGHDHGAALARDLGLTPLYLHYNSGLHISENGQRFAALLETLVAGAPRPLTLHIAGHSMGGLVARSAVYYGRAAGHTWPDHLRKLVCLGSPHHGSPLEQGGNWLHTLIGVSPYSAPFTRLGAIRSAGITDLRYGTLLEEDWRQRDRFKPAGDQRTPVPLPDGVDCYAIAATRAPYLPGSSELPGRLHHHLIGDALVPVPSALGEHADPAHDLAFPETHRYIHTDTHHLELLSEPDVYARLREWLAG